MKSTCFWSVLLLAVAFPGCSSQHDSDQYDISLTRKIDTNTVSYCPGMSRQVVTEEMNNYWIACICAHSNAIDYMVGLTTLTGEICSESRLVSCIKKYRKKLEICLDKSQLQETFSDVLNSVKAGYDYLCNDDKKHLKEFNDERTSNCVREKKSAFSSCRDSMPQDWMNVEMHRDFTRYSFSLEEVCNKRGQWATCVVKKLDECKDKQAKKVFQGVFAAMLLETPCRDFIYKSYPLLIPSEELEEKSATTSTSPSTKLSSTTSTTTDGSTSGVSQPVVHETTTDDGNRSAPVLGILIACLALASIFRVYISGY